MRRRWLTLGGVIIVAALIAFPLRQAIHETLIIPVAYLFWGLSVMYRTGAQVLWWILLVLLVILMLGNSLMPKPRSAKPVPAKVKPPRGRVEDLATWLQRAQGGIYFKWLVANKLGKLAYQILLYRENGRARSVFAPLVGSDWQPPKDLQDYLETGLHGSFADFPRARRSSGARRQTPLDHDVAKAVDFLESQIDDER